eukprot:9502618-Pyramimonas_sp.AAC.1
MDCKSVRKLLWFFRLECIWYTGVVRSAIRRRKQAGRQSISESINQLVHQLIEHVGGAVSGAAEARATGAGGGVGAHAWAAAHQWGEVAPHAAPPAHGPPRYQPADLLPGQQIRLLRTADSHPGTADVSHLVDDGLGP